MLDGKELGVQKRVISECTHYQFYLLQFFRPVLLILPHFWPIRKFPYSITVGASKVAVIHTETREGTGRQADRYTDIRYCVV
jgi:hypothetical protein